MEDIMNLTTTKAFWEVLKSKENVIKLKVSWIFVHGSYLKLYLIQ